MADELWQRGALELAGMIRSKEVSSREVLDAHLARIEQVNPAVNAVVRVLADEARAAADSADAAVGRGDELGVLHGVPITVKENIDVAGTPTTSGVVMLADAVSPVDAPIVARMRAAGAIPFARTNLPDLGLRVHTDSSLHGLTRNPWNAERTAGGSSGGEGSALASGMTPLGLGNDIGGSLRNPAHCCGITSIKPTTGRVPGATVIPPEDFGIAAQIMLADGPMARRVADVRAALEVIAGAHPRDPRSVDAPFHSGTTKRVAVLADPPGGTTDAGIAAVVRAAADHLSDAGYEVVEATPPDYEQAVQLWGVILGSEVKAMRPLLDMVMGDGGRAFLELAEPILATDDLAALLAAHTARSGVARRWSVWMEDQPIVISPTWAHPAFPHGHDIASAQATLEVFETLRPVLPGNLLGLPCAVVPGGVCDGLPVGVQVIGRAFHEMECLDVAQAIEDRVGILTPIDPR